MVIITATPVLLTLIYYTIYEPYKEIMQTLLHEVNEKTPNVYPSDKLIDISDEIFKFFENIF